MSERPSTKHNPAPTEPASHVVLVHGIWDNARTLRRMDAALQSAGVRTTLVTFTPNGGQIGLDALAIQMRDQIDARIAAHKPFSIVAFSMGGLVTRSYLRQFGASRRILTFVSISSPHRGTWMAWLLNNPGARDMRPGSAFLAAIDADAARHHAVRWITVRTPLDLIIVPARSSALPWALNHTIPVALHALMVWDRRVIERVVREFRPAP